MKALFVAVFFLTISVTMLSALESPRDFGNIRFSVGGGLNFLPGNSNQVSAYSNVTLNDNLSANSLGFEVFADLTQYFTVFTGYRIGMGQYQQNYTFSSSSGSNSYSNSVTQYEFGGELKYPLYVTRWFNWAPKIGLDDVIYSKGLINGQQLSADGEQLQSPLLFLLGADLNFLFNQNFFVRVPVALGFALNAKLSDNFYRNTITTNSGATPVGLYSAASTVAFKIGADLGYTF